VAPFGRQRLQIANGPAEAPSVSPFVIACVAVSVRLKSWDSKESVRVRPPPPAITHADSTVDAPEHVSDIVNERNREDLLSLAIPHSSVSGGDSTAPRSSCDGARVSYRDRIRKLWRPNAVMT
jgi:hypothetical protein